MFELSKNILKNIETILNKICDDKENEISKNSFTLHIIPEISISKYINRIIKYFECCDSFIIMAIIYINRLCQNSEIRLNKYSIHNLILVGCVISSKYLEDDHYSNDFYSEVGGISLKELNLLEINMLQSLEYNLHIDDSEYNNYIIKFTTNE